MLVPSALLVVACVLVGVLPAITIGPLLATAGAGDSRRAHAGVRARGLARVHAGIAHELRSRSRAASASICYLYLRGRTLVEAPVLSRLDSKRMFDIANVAVTRTAARAARWLFSRRLQTQLVLIVASACAAASLPLAAGGWFARQPAAHAARSDLRACSGSPARACAIGAAWQAKFHRLAALIMVGGRGARRGAHVRVAVGARSRADADRRRSRDDGAVPARPALAAAAARARRSEAAQHARQGAAPARRGARGRERRRHGRARVRRR